MNYNMFDLVTSYKKASAIMVLARLNIVASLSVPVTLDKIAKHQNLDTEKLSLFFTYLTYLDILHHRNNLYYLKPDAAKQLKDNHKIILHEANIMEFFNNPSNLEKSINGVVKKFTDYDRKLYEDAMNGQNLKFIISHIIRYSKSMEIKNCLELGNSKGKMREIFARFLPNVHVIENNIVFDGVSGWENTEFDLIFLYNTIHYMTYEKIVAILETMKRSMSENSVLCITDLFLNRTDYVNYQYIPDWLTHGGLNYLFLDELQAILEKCGLIIKDHTYLAGTGVTILYIKMEI